MMDRTHEPDRANGAGSSGALANDRVGRPPQMLRHSCCGEASCLPCIRPLARSSFRSERPM